MLDTDQLRSFLAIVDTGSFTRAALRVNKTQSAVSMHMRRLEEQLGRTLFNKEGRGVRLSQDGETLVDFARQMLRLEAGALAAVSDRALAGRVVLGLPDDYAEWLLPEIVKQFSRLHPMAEISIICDTSDRLVERVAAREIDLAVVTSSLAGNAPFELVLEQPLVWVASRHSSPHDRRPLPLALMDRPAAGAHGRRRRWKPQAYPTACWWCRVAARRWHLWWRPGLPSPCCRSARSVKSSGYWTRRTACRRWPAQLV